MKTILKAFGALFILTGIIILINRDSLFNYIEANMQETWFYITAIVARFIMGILFIKAADESRFPKVIKIIGILAILAAVIFMVIGKQNFLEFFTSLLPSLIPYAFISGLMVTVFGGFLIYAFSGGKVS